MSRLAGHKKTSARTHVLIDVTSCVISYSEQEQELEGWKHRELRRRWCVSPPFLRLLLSCRPPTFTGNMIPNGKSRLAAYLYHLCNARVSSDSASSTIKKDYQIKISSKILQKHTQKNTKCGYYFGGWASMVSLPLPTAYMRTGVFLQRVCGGGRGGDPSLFVQQVIVVDWYSTTEGDRIKTIIQFRSPSVTPSVKRDKQTNDELGNVPTRDSGTGRSVRVAKNSLKHCILRL